MFGYDRRVVWFFRHLSRSSISELHAVATKVGLVRDQDALLAGLPEDFVAMLPSAASQGARLLRALHQMNAVWSLADGTVPIAVWLENAARLTAAHMESAAFQSALADLRADTRTRRIV